MSLLLEVWLLDHMEVQLLKLNQSILPDTTVAARDVSAFVKKKSLKLLSTNLLV
jgi:hypothetical protein